MDKNDDSDAAVSQSQENQSDGHIELAVQNRANLQGSNGSLSAKLRDHSLRVFDALNHGRIADSVLQMLTPDFRMVCEKGIGPFTLCEGRDEFVHHFDDMLKGQGYHFNITNCSVNLSDSDRKAAAMLTGDVGVGGSVRIEVVNLLSWEWRKHDGWVCARGKCIRALSTDSMRDISDD